MMRKMKGNSIFSSSVSYTEGPIAKKMIVFALPLMATSIILQLFNTLDMAIAGQFISKESLAAVGSTTLISTFSIEFFLAFSTAANIVIAQYVGKGDLQNVNRTVHSAIAMALFFGIIIALGGFAAARNILELMSVPADIIDLSVSYLKIYFLGAPFLMLYNFCAAIFRSRGETRLPMLCLVFGGVIKVLLDLLFVVLFNWGVAGMALATVCANALSAFMLILFLMRRTDELKLRIRSIKADSKIVFALLKIGLPSSFLGSIFSISNLCMQSAINSLGADAIAASTAAAGIEIYIQFIGNAFAQAAVTFTAQNYGAGKVKRLNKITACSLLLCNALSVILTLLAYGFSDRLMRIFVTDAAVIALGIVRMKYTLLFKPLQAVMDIMSGCLQGYGYTLVPAIVSVFTVCGVRLLWIYTVFAQNRTLETLLAIYPITQGLAAFSHTVCYCLLQRKLKRGMHV